MAGISQYLKKIKEAVYGEEVRGSIHDAIQQAYTDANDVVKVSETQPTEENVKIWIKPESDEMKVPTWEEFEELADKAQKGEVQSSTAGENQTEEIKAALEKYGICRLQKGTYYVTGIVMPEGSTIQGIGAGSIIRLADGVTDKDIITVAKDCTVKDITIIGGNGNGIVWKDANASYGTVAGCVVKDFFPKGGGIAVEDAGMEIISGCIFDNAYLLLKNTNGNVVTNCRFGGDSSIEIDGGKPSIISDCIMQADKNAILLSNNAEVYAGRCVLADGGGFVEPFTTDIEIVISG